MRVRVKICGITTIGDALSAAEAGADAIGLMFYPASSRAVHRDQAAAIAKAVPPFVTKVAVLVDPSADTVRQIMDRVQLDVLQFHGDEPAEFCESFGVPYVKVIAMHTGVDVVASVNAHPNAAAIMLDTFHPTARGGTGETFDWALWPAGVNRPLILAGGLTVANVGEAIAATRPFAVDVSGGVEGPARGRKDPQKIRDFIREVHRDR